MPTDYSPSKAKVQSSIKSLNFELSNLTPSALIVFFEIDLNALLKTKGITLAEEAQRVGFIKNETDGILRFHNNVKVFNSYIHWQGNTYYPAPIAADGFESTSKGTLPTPTLSITSQSENATDQLALLKHEIKKFGDIIGAKVTRRRTFAKYLDVTNFGGRGILKNSSGASANEVKGMIPDGYEPDPYAELPKDVYFIERKETENKNIIKYQLSSVLDLEGVKLPKRTVISDKCVWQYRGIGCWYQHATGEENNTNNVPPVLQKAGLKKLTGGQSPTGLPKNAPPVANEKNEKILSLLPGGVRLNEGTNTNQGEEQNSEWSADKKYNIGNYVYLLKDNIKFYFVCKKTIDDEVKGQATIPPNTEYWIADECSKTIGGCRLRWGVDGKVNPEGCGIAKGELPYGGFQAARKVSRQR